MSRTGSQEGNENGAINTVPEDALGDCQRRIPADAVISPTAGCNPCGQLLAGAATEEETPSLACPLPPPVDEAEERGLSSNLRMSRAARALVTTNYITGTRAHPVAAGGHAGQVRKGKTRPVLGETPQTPPWCENAIGITGKPIKGRYGRPSLHRRVEPDSGSDDEGSIYSEDEHREHRRGVAGDGDAGDGDGDDSGNCDLTLEECADDILAGKILKDDGTDGNAGRACMQLVMMAVGGATMIALALVLVLLFSSAPAATLFANEPVLPADFAFGPGSGEVEMATSIVVPPVAFVQERLV